MVGLSRVELAEIERSRSKPTDKMDNYDFYLRGTALYYQNASMAAEKEFKKAIAEDPDYAAAYAMAAVTLQHQQVETGLPLSEKIGLKLLLDKGKTGE